MKVKPEGKTVYFEFPLIPLLIAVGFVVTVMGAIYWWMSHNDK